MPSLFQSLRICLASVAVLTATATAAQAASPQTFNFSQDYGSFVLTGSFTGTDTNGDGILSFTNGFTSSLFASGGLAEDEITSFTASGGGLSVDSTQPLNSFVYKIGDATFSTHNFLSNTMYSGYYEGIYFYQSGSTTTVLQIGSFAIANTYPSSQGSVYLSGLLDTTTNNLAYVTEVAPVPEPETYAMLIAGLGVLGALGRRQKNRAAGSATTA